MLLNKLKFATAVLIVGALAFGMTGFGVRLFLHSSVEAAQARVQKEAPKTPAGKEADKPKTDQELIQGTWVFVGLTVGGKKEWNENAPPKSLTFADDKVRSLVVNGDGKEAAFQSRFKLDASRKPKELDMTDLDGERKGKTTACVYEIDGDTLRLCHAARPGGDRPAALESKEGSTDYLWTLKRADKEKLKPATEKKEAEAKPQAVSGVVKTVDLEKNTLTVARIEGESAFSLAKDARIEIDGKAGRLAGLPAGANVTLTDFVDARTARSIQAGGRWYFGAPVVSVDATKNTITVDDKEGQKTFAVAQDACITVDGKGVKLAEVPRGAHLNLGLAADQTTARFIGADGPYLGGCGGSCVKAVDTINNTITFDDKALPEVAGKTFAVSKDAGITIDGNPGKLADVPVGCYVNLGLSVDQSTVLRVSAQGPSNLCECGGSPVKAVDATLNTITFDDKARAEVAGKTFPISKGANIVIDGKPGKLTDVPSGAYVSLRLSVDRQTAIHVHAQGPGGICDCGGSLVTAVDAEKHTITFDDKCRAEVAGKTFAVAKDALIAIDGKPGKLADLPAGAYVDLNLRVDRQTVGQINAQGPAVTGVLSAVDAEKNALTVADRTFNVAKDAVIVIDGKRGQLSGLATGVNVSLRLHVDQKTVGEIRVDAR